MDKLYIFSPIGTSRGFRGGLVPTLPKSLKRVEGSGVAGGSSPDLKLLWLYFSRS